MPELVVLPPELVTGKKENRPREVFRIPYLWIENDAGGADAGFDLVVYLTLIALRGGITRLVFDVAKLEYISSAGLRVLLAMQKLMNQQGEMVLQNVNEAVMEVFEVTGFSDILRIE